MNVLWSSASVEWSTPADLFTRLDRRHHFTLDAAATTANAKVANWLGPDHPDPSRRDIRSFELLGGSGDASKEGVHVEFKEQAVRFVFEEIGPDESRGMRVSDSAPRLNVKPATLMNWVKQRRRRPARRRRRARSRSCGRRSRRCARRTVSSLGRTRSCRPRRVSSGRRSTASQRGSGVRGRPSSSRGRADLQCVAGRPVRGPLGVGAPGRARQLADEALKPMIARVVRGELRVYGRRKIKAALRPRARPRRRQGPDRPADA